MPNHDTHPYPDDRKPQRQTGGVGGWRTGPEDRSFARDDSRTGYSQYDRDEDRPAYGGQGAYGQGRGPGGYGYGSQAERDRADDYGEGGQGGLGPAGGGYGAQGDPRGHQGQSTYGQDDYSRGARRSVARTDQQRDPQNYGQRGQSDSDRYDRDPHYRRWHDEQMRAHDNDYARWREERSRQYHQDYDSWRSQRHEAFSREFDNWRTGRGQGAVQDVTDGGDGSPDRDKS